MTRPSGSRFRWIATSGQGSRPDHRPVCAGFPGTLLLKVTLTGWEVPILREGSQAYAVRVCVPFASWLVSNEMVNGVVVAGRVTFRPSICSCTPVTGLSGSVALMLKATVPDSVAPATGALIDTTGGVVSGGGGDAPVVALAVPE